jgi:exodeoxyribonuclease III
MTTLKIFCWNIANPSAKRVGQQFMWLLKQDYDVFVLTETKNSEGCNLLINLFKSYGYNVVISSMPIEKEYGVMIVSKLNIIKSKFSLNVDYIPSRVASCYIEIDDSTKIELIGTYIPSRDISENKIERKKKFIDSLTKAFSAYPMNNILLCGDFNILEPSHIPKYRIFQNWEYDFYTKLSELGLIDTFRHLHPDKLEYSWVGRTNDGYRYDHSFNSKDLVKNIESCYYFHDPVKMKLSDHSAVITTLQI